MRIRPSEAAVGIGTCKRWLRGMSRSEGNWGPQFCSTAPAQHPSLPRHQIFFLGPPLRGDQSRADVRWGAGRTFSILALHRSPPMQAWTVSQRRAEENANSAQRNGSGNRYIQDTMEFLSGQLNITKDQATAQIAMSNFLKVPATVQDTANAAVLIASDRARMLTGTVVNATAGAALD